MKVFFVFKFFVDFVFPTFAFNAPEPNRTRYRSVNKEHISTITFDEDGSTEFGSNTEFVSALKKYTSIHHFGF